MNNGYAAGVARDNLYAPDLDLLRPDKSHVEEALAILERFGEAKRPNFVDCVSFALMRDRGIRIAFTFDARDFGLMDFILVPPWPPAPRKSSAQQRR